MALRFTTSLLFVASVRKLSGRQLRDSTIFPKGSVSSFLLGVRQAGGASAAQITLVAIGSLVLLVAAGTIAIVAFRRQTALLTESTTAPSDPVTGGILFPVTGNGSMRPAQGSNHSRASPTVDPEEPDTENSDTAPTGDGNELVCEPAFPESPYVAAEIYE
jgi:hypothetical protein